MSKLKTIWERVERYAIYAAIFAFIVLELLSYFVPRIAQAMDARGGLLLIAVILFFFFKYIDERLGDSKTAIMEVERTFTQGILEVLENKSEVETMDIFAHTGQKYLYALQESGVKVKHLRVLLRSFEDLGGVQFPTDEAEKQSLRQELRSVAESFAQLKRQGTVKSLEVRYYPFDPMCHFFIVDNRLLHFGMFQPKHVSPGVQVLTSFVVRAVTEEGHKLISDFRIFFDTTFDEFGHAP